MLLISYLPTVKYWEVFFAVHIPQHGAVRRTAQSKNTAITSAISIPFINHNIERQDRCCDRITCCHPSKYQHWLAIFIHALSTTICCI